jgi:aromatic ring-opening dioxygenase catalytic subunit (LigB family)
MNTSSRMPCLFIPHGGGPCFFMDGPPPFDRASWAGMERYLSGIGASVAPRPKAILVISGHWEADAPTLNTASRHSLYYDYYGFPEHTYKLTYPAVGSPELALRVRELFTHAGIPFEEDATRGLDHGVFIPFKLIYPDADIPIVQLSLRKDMDPSAHLAIGRALAPLRDEGILIVGTGMSYHNLREFRRRGAADAQSEGFDGWLVEAVRDPHRRDTALAGWADAPFALACHPEAEHLIPLHVVAGAAGEDVGKQVYRDTVNGKAVSAFQFG